MKLQDLFENDETLESYIAGQYQYDDDALAVVDRFDELVSELARKFNQSEKEVRSKLTMHFEDLGVYVSGGHNIN